MSDIKMILEYKKYWFKIVIIFHNIVYSFIFKLTQSDKPKRLREHKTEKKN